MCAAVTALSRIRIIQILAVPYEPSLGSKFAYTKICPDGQDPPATPDGYFGSRRSRIEECCCIVSPTQCSIECFPGGVSKPPMLAEAKTAVCESGGLWWSKKLSWGGGEKSKAREGFAKGENTRSCEAILSFIYKSATGEHYKKHLSQIALPFRVLFKFQAREGVRENRVEKALLGFFDVCSEE